MEEKWIQCWFKKGRNVPLSWNLDFKRFENVFISKAKQNFFVSNVPLPSWNHIIIEKMFYFQDIDVKVQVHDVWVNLMSNLRFKMLNTCKRIT